MRVIIVGGGRAGLTAAKRLSLLDKDAEIVLVEKTDGLGLYKSALPYYIGGKIKDKSELFSDSAAFLTGQLKLDLRLESQVVDIDPGERSVTIQDQDSQYELGYDRLVLSTGRAYDHGSIPGVERFDNAFSLASLEEAEAIKAFIEEKNPESAIVIGSGPTGLAMAENLLGLGIRTSIVEEDVNIFPDLDIEMGRLLAKRLEAGGLDVRVGKKIQGFTDSGRMTLFEDNTGIQSDLIILAEARPADNDLARRAGLETSSQGDILVDQYYETSQDDIYAIGEVIEDFDSISKEPRQVRSSSVACMQGQDLAGNLAGYSRANNGSIVNISVKALGLIAGRVGLNEKYLIDHKYNFKTIHDFSSNYASFTGKDSSLALKISFNPATGDLYGAQALGGQGTDKRLDVLATAIRAGLRTANLEDLNLSSFPSLGLEEDPVFAIGQIGQDLREGITDNVQWYEVDKYINEGWQILDVRNQEELEKNGKIIGSINIPLGQLEDRLDELDKDQAYIITCQSGKRGFMAERLLKGQGFKVANLDGAFMVYSQVLPGRIMKDI